MLSEDIQKKFVLATDWVSKNNMTATNDEKLMCYGYYKQATEGDNNSDKPWAFQLEKNAKWTVWEANKGISLEEAKKLYITKIIELRAKYNF